MRRSQTRRRIQKLKQLPAHDRWLISYADFVTLLLAVFVVLFAVSWRNKQTLRRVSTSIELGFESLGAGSKNKAPEVLAPPGPDNRPEGSKGNSSEAMTEDLDKQLMSVLGDAISRQEIVMQKTPEGLVISLRELGFFNSGEAKLLPGAADKLQKTAKVLMEHGLELRVEGHSDDQPIHTAAFQSNWELSTARAMSVLSMLVDHAGFPSDKISVAGYGPYRPVGSNQTAEGRRMNRRVDLVVISPSH